MVDDDSTLPRAWRARSVWPATWPLSSASIRIRAMCPPAASIRTCASHADRYTATSWLEDHRYLNMDYLKDQKKELMQTAA